MTIGNFWPSMTCNIDMWKGSEPTSWYYPDPLSSIYKSNFDWSRRGVRCNHATSCREIMSNDLRSSANRLLLIFQNNFDHDIQKRVTLNINKPAPSKEWLSIWRSSWVFPNLIKSFHEVGSHMEIVLNNHFMSIGAPQAVFSMSFFFLNRHEAFPIELMADPDKMIRFLLNESEGMWQGSLRHGPMSFSHAFAVYVANIMGDVYSFEKLIACNGVGQYVLRELIISNAKDLVDFVARYKISVNDYVTSAYAGASLSAGQVINAVRASNIVSNPTTW